MTQEELLNAFYSILVNILGWSKTIFPSFSQGFGWLLSSIGGALITYCFTRCRDKKLDVKKERNELIATCNSICFSLALQLSELINLKKNINDRILALDADSKAGTNPNESIPGKSAQDSFSIKLLI